jgi:outer membrane protein OmpA-like peptidoglycan-associated protein
MKMKLIAMATTAMLIAGCTANPYTGEQQLSKTATGAGAGAILGGVTGLVLGETTSLNTRKSVLIGAGLGALAGGGVGLYMDNQESKLRQRLQGSGVSVTRNGDRIILNMPSNITFDSDQANIKPGFYDTLNSVAIVLAEFNQSYVDVVGHTDSDGSAAYNRDLSRQRAASVARYLTAQQLDSNRFSVDGRGENEPIASNGSQSGKAQNRRVEIEIAPIT